MYSYYYVLLYIVSQKYAIRKKYLSPDTLDIYITLAIMYGKNIGILIILIGYNALWRYDHVEEKNSGMGRSRYTVGSIGCNACIGGACGLHL